MPRDIGDREGTSSLTIMGQGVKGAVEGIGAAMQPQIPKFPGDPFSVKLKYTHAGPQRTVWIGIGFMVGDKKYWNIPEVHWQGITQTVDTDSSFTVREAIISGTFPDLGVFATIINTMKVICDMNIRPWQGENTVGVLSFNDDQGSYAVPGEIWNVSTPESEYS